MGLSGSGHQTLFVKINNSYATGNVSGRSNIGGLVGTNQGTITKCNAIGQVSGGGNMGGLVGKNTGGIDDSYVTGQVLGTTKFSDCVGGLVGRSDRGSRITDSYATAKVSGRHIVGGLVGASYESSTIQSSYATGTVSGIRSGIGGLVGKLYGTIQSSYATGNVLGGYYLGGLVGLIGSRGSTFHVKVNNSYATGSVSGEVIIGGLAGDNRGTIANCYAIGQVIARRLDRVGGLVGLNSRRIENSYGKRQLRSTNTLGAKTDTELKTPSTFTGWDTSVWKLSQNQYPKLKRLN